MFDMKMSFLKIPKYKKKNLKIVTANQGSLLYVGII